MQDYLIKNIFMYGLNELHSFVKEQLIEEGNIPLDRAVELLKT